MYNMKHLMGLAFGLFVGVASASNATADTPQIPTVDSLEITALTDNYYDMFQPDGGNATRFLLSRNPSEDAIAVKGEMGLALVVKATKNGVTKTILFDQGLTNLTYINNLDKLGIDIRNADGIVISHGHKDHWGALPTVLFLTSQKNTPVYVGGEDVFLQHLFVTPTNTADMGTLDRDDLTHHHRQLIVSNTPNLIAGVGLLTGFIPQTNTFENIPAALKDVRNGVVENSQFTEETALVFNVAGKGLVVITGCSHRGVINATTYAKQITGINQVAGVIGGFHMTTAPQTTIDATVAAFQSMAVTYVMPMHCTGNRALNALMNGLAAAYVHPSVGTVYRF